MVYRPLNLQALAYFSSHTLSKLGFVLFLEPAKLLRAMMLAVPVPKKALGPVFTWSTSHSIDLITTLHLPRVL